jgi:hypothetical protein
VIPICAVRCVMRASSAVAEEASSIARPAKHPPELRNCNGILAMPTLS